LTSADQHDGIDKLIGMIDTENARPKRRNVLNAHNFDISKENRQDGMKKSLDTKMQQFFHFFQENVNGQQKSHGGDLPGLNKGKDMEDNLDGTFDFFNVALLVVAHQVGESQKEGAKNTM